MRVTPRRPFIPEDGENDLVVIGPIHEHVPSQARLNLEAAAFCTRNTAHIEVLGFFMQNFMTFLSKFYMEFNSYTYDMCMKLKFTDHAQFRLYNRSFSVDQMKKVILQPDFTEISYGGKIVSEKTFSNGKLGVVYVTRGNLYIIITVYFPY